MLWVQFYLHLRSLIGGLKSRNRIVFCYTNEKKNLDKIQKLYEVYRKKLFLKVFMAGLCQFARWYYVGRNV